MADDNRLENLTASMYVGVMPCYRKCTIAIFFLQLFGALMVYGFRCSA